MLPTVQARRTEWKAMQDFQAQGKAKAIGVRSGSSTRIATLLPPYCHPGAALALVLT